LFISSDETVLFGFSFLAAYEQHQGLHTSSGTGGGHEATSDHEVPVGAVQELAPVAPVELSPGAAEREFVNVRKRLYIPSIGKEGGQVRMNNQHDE
jgi:hypothetical protein